MARGRKLVEVRQIADPPDADGQSGKRQMAEFSGSHSRARPARLEDDGVAARRAGRGDPVERDLGGDGGVGAPPPHRDDRARRLRAATSATTAERGRGSGSSLTRATSVKSPMRGAPPLSVSSCQRRAELRLRRLERERHSVSTRGRRAR